METFIITTPQEKHQVELKKWITGREYEEIQAPLNNLKVQIDASKTNPAILSEINLGEITRKTTEIAIKTIVVSIDGDKNNVLDKVLNMAKNDYLFVVQEVDKVYKGDFFQKAE